METPVVLRSIGQHPPRLEDAQDSSDAPRSDLEPREDLLVETHGVRDQPMVVSKDTETSPENPGPSRQVNQIPAREEAFAQHPPPASSRHALYSFHHQDLHHWPAPRLPHAVGRTDLHARHSYLQNVGRSDA